MNTVITREETATSGASAQKVTKPGKRGKPGRPSGPDRANGTPLVKTGKPLSGAPETKLRAAAVLEVLAGVRTPTDAAQALSVSLPRYYLLEQQAVQGLISALEPRDRGPGVSDQRRILKLERQLAQAQREVSRQQALARVTQRTLGLGAPVSAKEPPRPQKGSVPAGRKRRSRRPSVRALRAATALRTDSRSSESAAAVEIPLPDGAANALGNGATTT